MLRKVTPAPGAVTEAVATIFRKAGSFIAARARVSWSAAVLRVLVSMPLTPVYVVARIPSPAAARFIFATNAFSSPAPQRASSRATLLPDGTIISSSSRRWVYSRPASTGAVVSTEEYDSSAAR